MGYVAANEPVLAKVPDDGIEPARPPIARCGGLVSDRVRHPSGFDNQGVHRIAVPTTLQGDTDAAADAPGRSR